MAFWQDRRVLVTGGASFIGSHLVEQLGALGARVRIADDFSSGRRENIDHVDAEIREGDLRDAEFARTAVAGCEVVFHLAADHGGRGYVDLHQVACASNLGMDQAVFTACLQQSVERVVYASSGCVYPNYLQSDLDEELYLHEDLAGPPYDPDGMYGLAKLAGELTLRAMHREHGLGAASCRYFTVYGPRGVENHAVMAMIARAFIREDPYVVWGTGEQIRNWTFVDDIVRGTILAGERIDDGTPVNLGTMERVRVLDAVRMVFELAGYHAEIETHPEMPTGPLNRVADNRRAHQLLGWRPEVTFAEGLERTLKWYFASKDPDVVAATLYDLLTERPRDVADLTGT